MGTISLEHGDRLYWLGRYAERVFTTLKSLERLYDKVIDRDPSHYIKYLECFGLTDIFGDCDSFMHDFIYDKNNSYSVAYSLERAYDNGIVLREEISTEALSFIQIAMDKLDSSHNSDKSLCVSMLPIEDTLFGFWGCIHDYVYDEEIKDIILCGKSVERLELYIRLKYRTELINLEFERLCDILRRIPKNTPYRYNTEQLSILVEIIGGVGCKGKESEALSALARLFEH
ncbi:MAG: alpha-E domain-containing protein [Oscillospiraceae bacterium]|nr:alpha-E domain-containing protein [Oscillospiraceae bacterium]